VIGDLAAVTHQTGAAARWRRWQSRRPLVARAIGADPPTAAQPRRYQDKAPGDDRAAGRCGGLRPGGAQIRRLAGVAVHHLYFLIGFENRLLWLLQWAWSYVTFRAARG
jgi:hypothetical protein